MDDLLIVFAKAPVPGRVKTRLTPRLSPEDAAAFYDASLRDVFERAGSIGAERVVFFDPAEEARGFFADAFPGAKLVAQCGADLGERLRAAFDWAFERGAVRVLIIGGDSPTLPVAHLADAKCALATADVVIGPTADGGYYLVGIRAGAWPAAAALFERVEWSTETVLETTLRRARAAGVGVQVVGGWYDVDRPEDLTTAAADAAPDSRVGRFLSRVVPPNRP